MSRAVRTALPLSALFTVSAVSAALAFLAAPWVLAQMEGRIRVQNLTPDVMAALGYAGVFLCAFPALSFLSRHVKFSARARGERTRGAAPLLARFLLAAAVFAGPFFMTVRAHTPRMQPSLNSLIAESAHKPEDMHGPGYKKQDREKLEQLIHKEGAP